MKQKGYVWKKVMSGKEIVRMLELNGWIYKNQEGSHMIYQKYNHHVSVPNHNPVKPGLYHSIIRKVKFVESLNK